MSQMYVEVTNYPSLLKSLHTLASAIKGRARFYCIKPQPNSRICVSLVSKETAVTPHTLASSIMVKARFCCIKLQPNSRICVSLVSKETEVSLQTLASAIKVEARFYH